MKLWCYTAFLVGAAAAVAQTVSVPLAAEAGVPLRLYVTGRVPMKMAQPVTARVLDPVYSFDRIVIPVGAEVHGSVVKLDPVAKLVRIHAVLGGDFTPLHFARVEFTTLSMPDGKVVPIHTESSEGLTSIYQPPKPPKKPAKTVPAADPAQAPGLLEQAQQQARQAINRQIDTQLNSRTLGVGSVIRGPNKKEHLVDLLMARLPYHPQWYRRGTRFDSVLMEKIDWGATEVASSALASVGVQPNVARLARVRFLSTVSSADASVGDKVEAVLSQPLAGPSGAMLLPEGTHMTGSVRQARPARWFHRSGQLRFTFDQVEPPAYAHAAGDTQKTLQTAEAHVEAADTDPTANVKIDSEGGAKATESKTRFIAPAISALIAMKAGDNDEGRHTATGASGAGRGNPGGLTLGGFSGFGMLGAAVARTSSNVGVGLGWWGTAATVYSTVVSRGHDVVFARNTEMDVRFGPRPAPEEKRKSRK